jgi:hypothetical protein
MSEEFYLKKCRKSGARLAFRRVHKATGETVYGGDQGSYHGSGYRKQTLDLTDPNAHWSPPTPV